MNQKNLEKTNPAFAGFCHFLCIYKPNSVVDSYLSSPEITRGVKRHFAGF